MNIKSWIKSAYVTYIGKPSFLSSGGLAPPIKEGKPPGSVVSHIGSIAHFPNMSNYIFFKVHGLPSSADKLPSCPDAPGRSVSAMLFLYHSHLAFSVVLCASVYHGNNCPFHKFCIIVFHGFISFSGVLFSFVVTI